MNQRQRKKRDDALRRRAVARMTRMVRERIEASLQHFVGAEITANLRDSVVAQLKTFLAHLGSPLRITGTETHADGTMIVTISGAPDAFAPLIEAGLL